MRGPYHYVRFRWWSSIDPFLLEEEMRALDMDVTKLKIPEYELNLSLQKEYRDELIVKSDTLTAHLSQFRAVLTQKEDKPFTSKDMKLRPKIIEVYQHSRPTPLPWNYVDEPLFKVAK